jgi:hypothetical protein
MNSEDWVNVSKCADARVMARTFSFDDEENNILGDLETREMARAQAYRETLISSTYMDITMEIVTALNQAELIEDVADKKVTGIRIDIVTE